jgi:hypothetical protein
MLFYKKKLKYVEFAEFYDLVESVGLHVVDHSDYLDREDDPRIFFNSLNISTIKKTYI